jgi:hypothetical protein
MVNVIKYYILGSISSDFPECQFNILYKYLQVFILVLCNLEFNYNYGVVFNIILIKYGEYYMAAIAVNRFGGGPANGFVGNALQSEVQAKPSLQGLNEEFVSQVYDGIGDIHKVKGDNFDFKKDKFMSILMAVATVALGVLGAVAIFYLNATGLGVGALAIGTYTALVSYLAHQKGKEKLEHTSVVESVFKDASCKRLEGIIKTRQSETELMNLNLNNRFGARGLNRVENPIPYLQY